MLNLYFGRESIDKDKFLYESIKGESIIIVPDQFTLQAERDAFFYLQGTKVIMDLEILSFSRLGNRILWEVGGVATDMIDKQGRHMLLCKILRALDNSNEKPLEIYKGYSSNTEFIEMTNNFISEMKQHGLTPTMLLQKLEGKPAETFLYKKVSEMQKIFMMYQDAITDKYLDTEDHVDLYCSKMAESKWIEGKSIWVHGFDCFTPKNLMALTNLLLTAKEVNVVLSCDDTREEDIFQLGQYVLTELKNIADKLGLPCHIKNLKEERAKYGINRPADLEYLEREIFKISSRPNKESENINLVRAANYYGEASTVAREVLRLISQEGYLLREIGLITNDMENRGHIYKRVFKQFGLDIFLDKKRNVLHNPVAIFLMSLLDIMVGNYRQEDLLKSLKTGLWDLPSKDVELLENYAIDYRINGKLWKIPFTKGAEELGTGEVEHLEQLRKQIMDKLLVFGGEFKASSRVLEKVKTVYTFLEEKMMLPDKITEMMKEQIEANHSEVAGETSQIWNVIIKILDQLVTILGSEKMSMRDFAMLIRAGLESVEIGVLPPTVDGLIMGTSQRTRNSRIKALMVLGANEGVFPAEPSNESLFSEEEKEKLNQGEQVCKLEIVQRQEESLGIYKNLTKPTEKLWITMAVSDETGKNLKPSPLFEKVREVFGITPKKDLENSQEEMWFLGGKHSTLNNLARVISDGREKHVLGEEELEALLWYKENAPVEMRQLETAINHRGDIEDIKPKTTALLYKSDIEKPLSLSPSRLERFGACPFAHFVKYGIKPKERNNYTVGASDMGNLYHHCLMVLSQELTEEGKEITGEDSPWMTMTWEECKERIGVILGEEASSYREGLLRIGKEEEYRLDRMWELCAKAAWHMIEQVRQGEIKTMGYEVPFKAGAELAPIRIQCSHGEIFIEGKIDRVDTLKNNGVKIIDYKSGIDKYFEEEARNGVKLQLFVYLRAATGENRKPAGAFYFHIKEPFINASGQGKNGLDTTLATAIGKEFRMDGVMVNDPDVIRQVAGEFDTYSSIVPIRAKKDGGFSGTTISKLLDEEKFTRLIEDISKQVDNMCRDLVAGKIAIQPKISRHISACKYCEYKGVCKFDSTVPGCEYLKF